MFATLTGGLGVDFITVEAVWLGYLIHIAF